MSALSSRACGVLVMLTAFTFPPQRDVGKPTVGTAVVAGIVRNDDAAAQPVRRVLVTLSGAENGTRQVVTDDAGRFAFPELAAGRYTLTAEKPGHVKSFYGSKRPGRGPSTPIALTDGQRLTDVAIRLLRGAVIAGTVTDEHGVPLASAQVSALQPQFVTGQRRLVDPPGPAQRATTDEGGRYRLYGLPPGEYTVTSGGSSGMLSGVAETTTPDIDAAMRELQQPAAPNRAGVAPSPTGGISEPRQVSRARVYLPGVADPGGAEIITLGAGEERTGANLTVPLVRAARVDVMSLGPDGRPLQNVMISMVNVRDRALYTSPGLYRPGADGRFTIPSMPPGEWMFVGRGAENGAPANTPMTFWAEAEFVVNSGQDVSGVVLQFGRGMTVSGRVSFQGTIAPPPLANLKLSLTPVGVIAGSAAAPTPVTPQADGTFAFTGLAPGTYRVSVPSAGPWWLRSSMLNGRDTLDVPFDVSPGQDVGGLNVLFTDQPTEISGRLVDQLGRPTSEYSIFIFSADRVSWGTSPRRTSGAVKLATDGRYRVVGLPSGEYHLVALTDVEPGQLNDPSFLELLAQQAVKITLAEGEKKTQDLKLGGGV